MGRLSIYCCAEASIFFWCCQDVQEGHGAICSGIFTSKLDVLVYRIDVVQKFLLCADLMFVKVSSTYPFQR